MQNHAEALNYPDDYTTEVSQLYTIEPPPQGVHPSVDAAIDAIHKWTQSRRYDVSRQKIERNNDNEIRSVLFACDRSGNPKNTRRIREEDRVRTLRVSKRMGCPMRIKIVAIDRYNTTGTWEIVYTRDGSPTHNHPPSLDVRVHTGYGQRSVQQNCGQAISSANELVALQTEAGIPVSRIYSTLLLLANTNSLAIPKDIANTEDVWRREMLATDTAIEVLFRQLSDHGFRYKYEIESDSNPRLMYLRAHPQTLELSCHYMVSLCWTADTRLISTTGPC
ncbi:hypothetical protein PHMEG_00038374 [Phytophthora megakarya]|uniref:FAR1 domain-containing protein n=1 Tax=Phytophthora megakarya TaxID=4795 RepID=A0A225UHK3_9STRA|nr:hypothetical protein PHMEG_00038374 [Phytophthora megakarya]